MTICSGVRMRHDSFTNTCIGSLFKARVSSASKADSLRHCEVHTRKNPRVYVTEVSAGVVRVSSGNESVVWRLTCSNQTDMNTTVTRGTKYLSVPTGCSLGGLDVSYRMLRETVRSSRHVRLVAWSSQLPASWTDRFRTLVNVTRLLRDADVWRKANELEDEFRHHLLAQAVSSGADYDLGGTVVVAVATAFALAIAVNQYFLWRALRGLRHPTEISTVSFSPTSEEKAPLEPSSSVDASEEEERTTASSLDPNAAPFVLRGNAARKGIGKRTETIVDVSPSK